MKKCLLVVALGAVLCMSGCALVQKGLDAVTPEISVGVYKDGVGGVTIGVKLEKNKPEAKAEDAPAPVVEEPKGEEK